MKEKIFDPLTDFLKSYAESDVLRCHMPGHKGEAPKELPQLSPAYRMDITEIAGADSLFEDSGILLAGEKRTAAVYGSGSSCWSAGGSTLCIQAMLAKMRAEGRTVLAPRTVHRSFLNSCVLLDLNVKWIFPRRGGIIGGMYALADFDAALREMKNPCVYVTSPDYLGNMLDIGALSQLCRQYHAPLLVDNAHGAHLAFLAENRHPIALGADLCCDSAHKTLPALTGAAILHCKKAEDARELKGYMEMFGSTSPSYLILQSLESCTAFLEQEGTAVIRKTEQDARILRERLSGQYTFLGNDPFHITIACHGDDLASQLRGQGVECEYSSRECIVLLLSAAFRDFERLENALLACTPKAPVPMPPCPQSARAAMSLRQAALSPHTVVPLSQALGRICGPVQVPCPPAVPLAVSGEILDKEWLEMMAWCGLQEAAVTAVSKNNGVSGQNFGHKY